MRSQALYALAILLILDTCILTLHASAQEPPVASREGTAEALSHLERRLDELEQENRAIRAENAQLLNEFQNSSIVGQIRISKPIPGPGTPGPDRAVDDIWAVGAYAEFYYYLNSQLHIHCAAGSNGAKSFRIEVL